MTQVGFELESLRAGFVLLLWATTVDQCHAFVKLAKALYKLVEGALAHFGHEGFLTASRKCAGVLTLGKQEKKIGD